MAAVSKIGKSAILSVPDLNIAVLKGLSIREAFSLIRQELVIKGLVRGDIQARTKLVEDGLFANDPEKRKKFLEEGLVPISSSGPYAWGDWEYRRNGVRISCAMAVTDIIPGSDEGRVLFSVRERLEGYAYSGVLDVIAASRGFVPDSTFKIDKTVDEAIIKDMLFIGSACEYNMAHLSEEEKAKLESKIDKNNASEGVINVKDDERLINMPVFLLRVSPEDIDRALAQSMKAKAFTFEEIATLAEQKPENVTIKVQRVFRALEAQQPQHYFAEAVG